MSEGTVQAETTAGAEDSTVTTGAAVQSTADTNAQDQGGANTSQDERTRIQGILNHANAEGRGKLANHLAFNTEMSVEQAGEMLAAAEQEVSESVSTDTPLDTAMGNAAQPQVGADTGTDAEVSDSQRIVGAFNKATGRK